MTYSISISVRNTTLYGDGSKSYSFNVTIGSGASDPEIPYSIFFEARHPDGTVVGQSSVVNPGFVGLGDYDTHVMRALDATGEPYRFLPGVVYELRAMGVNHTTNAGIAYTQVSIGKVIPTFDSLALVASESTIGPLGTVTMTASLMDGTSTVMRSGVGIELSINGTPSGIRANTGNAGTAAFSVGPSWLVTGNNSIFAFTYADAIPKISTSIDVIKLAENPPPPPPPPGGGTGGLGMPTLIAVGAGILLLTGTGKKLLKGLHL